MDLLVNIDVDDLESAIRFYSAAFELRIGRRFGPWGVEMLGSPAPIYLLARRLLGGVLLPTVFVAGFFLMPTVTEVAYDAFYPIIWAALPIGFATYFLLTDRVRPGIALALLALPI